jgi:hypothetical protein
VTCLSHSGFPQNPCSTADSRIITNYLKEKQVQDQSKLSAFIFLGLATVGYQLGNAAIQYKKYERTVTAKGLSEHE